MLEQEKILWCRMPIVLKVLVFLFLLQKLTEFFIVLIVGMASEFFDGQLFIPNWLLTAELIGLFIITFFSQWLIFPKFIALSMKIRQEVLVATGCASLSVLWNVLVLAYLMLFDRNELYTDDNGLWTIIVIHLLFLWGEVFLVTFFGLSLAKRFGNKRT